MPKVETPSKGEPVSFRPDHITAGQLADLCRATGRSQTGVICTAIERMWREEMPRLEAAAVQAENDRLAAALVQVLEYVRINMDGSHARSIEGMIRRDRGIG